MREQLVTQDIGGIVRGHQTALNARPPRGQQMLRVYDFMREFFRENDQLPPCRVIADKFGFASCNAAQTHLDSLARRGLIEKNAVGKWRFARGQKDGAWR